MRPEKSLLLQEIQDQIESSQSLVIAMYQKMDPNLSSDFRTNLAKTGGSFEIVKKRMLIKAAEKAGFSLDRENLQGHIGVIFASTDPVETTKYVYDFSKGNKENFTVLGGRFEGKTCSEKDLELISQLPSRDGMRAQFLGLLEAPMSQTLAVMEAVLCSVPFCLENKAALENKDTSQEEVNS
jgi:large subunit ribosomal protein L10